MVSTPLKNISQWEGLSHILWKIKNVPNHQPVSHIQPPASRSDVNVGQSFPFFFMPEVKSKFLRKNHWPRHTSLDFCDIAGNLSLHMCNDRPPGLICWWGFYTTELIRTPFTSSHHWCWNAISLWEFRLSGSSLTPQCLTKNNQKQTNFNSLDWFKGKS